jgi:hypothetical protein
VSIGLTYGDYGGAKVIKSLKIQSIIFKVLHNAWLTGDVAKGRNMIKKYTKVPNVQKI